jgi:signal transduction histidine kinase
LVPGRVQTLRRLAASDAERARAAEVERLAGLKLTEMQRTLGMVQAGRRDEAVDVIRGGTGKQYMDGIRTTLGEIKAEEDVNLGKRAAESAAMLSWSKMTNVVSAVLGGLLVGVAALVMFRDIAARERAKAHLQRANEELEQNVAERTTELRRSNRALEEFASVASHDLQEPLRKIQQFGDRLDKKLGPALDDANRDYLRRMLDAAGRMRTLISDLLTYSRVSTKSQQPVRVNLTDIVRGVVGDLDGRLQQAEGQVEVGELPEVDAEPTQMRQLFQNLIGNALKFQKPGVPPVVRVAGRLLDGDGGPRVELEVADNGIGFDEKYAEKIFHLFQRLHGRDEYEGTGMGLAIVRKIVEQHGGAVAAKSRPGEGATFVVTLPAPRNEGLEVL